MASKYANSNPSSPNSPTFADSPSNCSSSNSPLSNGQVENAVGNVENVSLESENRKMSSSNSSTISSTPSSGSRGEKRRWEKPEQCLICGQPAQCLNFGAHCCHACRMFFRRSVLNFKEFTCKFDGNCDTTKGKNCRACRFNACVLAQLDISLIQFPMDYDVGALKRRLEEKRLALLLKREKQQYQNVQQHQQQGEDGSAAESLPMESLVEKFQSFATIMELVEFNKCLEHLLLAERQATKLRHSPNNLILEYLCGKSLADILVSQMNVLNFVELFTMNGSPLKTPEEMAMEGVGMPFIGSYLNLDALLSIELMRTLPVCDGLGLEDKVSLFQQNTSKLVTLCSGFHSHLMQAETVTYPNQLRPANLCRNTLERTLGEEKLKRYINLRRRAFSDVVAEFGAINLSLEEFVLLRAAVFCNTVPEQCSANAKTALKAEAERYGRCLLRHLQLKLGDAAGARKYAECLLFATKIFDYSRRQAKFYQLLDREVFAAAKDPQNDLKRTHPPFLVECLLEVDEWRALSKLS